MTECPIKDNLEISVAKEENVKISVFSVINEFFPRIDKHSDGEGDERKKKKAQIIRKIDNWLDAIE